MFFLEISAVPCLVAGEESATNEKDQHTANKVTYDPKV